MTGANSENPFDHLRRYFDNVRNGWARARDSSMRFCSERVVLTGRSLRTRFFNTPCLRSLVQKAIFAEFGPKNRKWWLQAQHGAQNRGDVGDRAASAHALRSPSRLAWGVQTGCTIEASILARFSSVEAASRAPRTSIARDTRSPRSVASL